MRKIWKTIKVLLCWLIGISTVIVGLKSFFDTYGVMPKIFGGILLSVGLYLIPKIYDYLNLNIKSKIIVIIYLIGLIGLSLTSDNKPDGFFVDANELNVRKGAGKNFEVIYQLREGEELAIIDKGENWSKILSYKGEGYAPTKYLLRGDPKDYIYSLKEPRNFDSIDVVGFEYTKLVEEIKNLPNTNVLYQDASTGFDSESFHAIVKSTNYKSYKHKIDSLHFFQENVLRTKYFEDWIAPRDFFYVKHDNLVIPEMKKGTFNKRVFVIPNTNPEETVTEEIYYDEENKLIHYSMYYSGF